jgi:hypothetical protein
MPLANSGRSPKFFIETLWSFAPVGSNHTDIVGDAVRPLFCGANFPSDLPGISGTVIAIRLAPMRSRQPSFQRGSICVVFMSLELAANPACCAAVLTSLFTSAAEAGRTPMANSEVHARASAPNIASPRDARPRWFLRYMVGSFFRWDAEHSNIQSGRIIRRRPGSPTHGPGDMRAPA